jgi:exocyst complex component 8
MSRGFNPEQYIASNLTGASEEELQAFYESLQELRISTSSDLQANVFNNYASFVSLSHEISSLTSDLSSLSSLLVQFSSLTQSLSSSIQSDDSTSNDPSYPRERRGAQHHRNSVADLVEGSQKFLPASPGRHVIKESLNWTELNSATWKPTKIVHLILLNDHLLIAARKTGRASGSTRKSVADRCWNLLDVEINSLKETRLGAADGALQVTRGREVAVYAPPEGRAAEQSSFIQAFKRANADLHNKRRQEGHGAKQIQPASVVVPTSSRMQGNDVILRRVSMNFGAFGMLDGGMDKSTRWIQDRMDDLDVLIAMRDFEEAVRSLDKGTQPHSHLRG